MTTKEYRALGYETVSPARHDQLMTLPFAAKTVRRLYGPDHWNWKGGHFSGHGYRAVSRMGKVTYEHRIVAEEMLGRPLTPDEVVHHKDGNRTNNSPENLEVMARAAHDKIKDETRAYFHTGTDCEEAARTLYGLGWPKAKIIRALRIHHNTLKRWLQKAS